MSKRMRVQPKHWSMMLDYLELNPGLVTGKFSSINSKQKSIELWKEITIRLNALGLGSKSEEKWKSALIDWKCKVKAKCQEIKLHKQATGGGPEFEKKLNDNERRLMDLLGWSAVHGANNVAETGLQHVDENASEGVVDTEGELFDIINIPIEISTEESTPLESVKLKRLAPEIPAPIPAHKKNKITPRQITADMNSSESSQIEKFQTETITVLKEINHNLSHLSNKFEETTLAIKNQTTVLERLTDIIGTLVSNYNSSQ